MSKRFENYADAYYYASTRTKELQQPHGIARQREFGRDGFNVTILPKDKAKRFGRDLTCEAVEIGSPVIPPHVAGS